MLSGIPQGSIVGPALFFFYINGLFSKITNVKVKMLADDCVLYAKCPSLKEALVIYTVGY